MASLNKAKRYIGNKGLFLVKISFNYRLKELKTVDIVSHAARITFCLNRLDTNAYRLSPYNFTFYTFYWAPVMPSGKQRDIVEYNVLF